MSCVLFFLFHQGLIQTSFAELGTPDQMLFKIKQIRGLPGGSSLPLYDNDQCRILIRVFAMFTVTFKLKGGGRFRAA